LFASSAAIGTVSAQAPFEVSGTLRSESDGDVAGTELRLSNVSSDQRAETTVEPNGAFEVTVPETGEYRMTVFDVSPERDSVPVVHSFDDVSISDGGDLGEFSLPEAHDVSIRFVDTNGDPVEGLPVNFRAENGTGTSPGTFTTDSEGYTKYDGVPDPGVELAGRTQIEIQRTGEPPTPIETVFVDGPNELEFSLQDPERFLSESVTYSDGGRDGSAERESNGGTRERGLFSNSGDEPAFVSDPLNLTTIGFALSVAGIGYQMIEGR
jgi:hypothetical protein